MEPIQCKHCGASIPPENIVNDGRLAVCAYCDTVHQLGMEPIPEPEKPKHEKAKRQIPDKFIIEQHPQGVELRYRWLGKQHWGMLFFTVFWDGFMLFWITISLVSKAYAMLLFGGLHIAIGAGLAFYVVRGFVNRTSILIADKGIAITHGPITIFTQNRHIDRRAIEQVYCMRRVAYTSNDSPVYVFDVHYVVKGGDDEVLVKGLDSINKAIFIEQQIERLYIIDDEPVEGEYQRS